MRPAFRERLVLGAILAGSLLLSLVPPLARGALGIARNDDWDFSWCLFASVEAGHLVVDPWTSAMLWGHLVWAWPLVVVLGENRAALQVATALIGAGALLSLYGLLRRWTPPWVAITTVALTAFGPLYPLLAGSYMTDVPAFALQVLALGLGARALCGPDIRWLSWAGSLGLALAGFTVREYSAAVLAGLVAGLVVRRPGRRDMVLAVAGLGLWAVLAATLFWLRLSSTTPMWAAGLEGGRPPIADSLAVTGRGVATLSLLVLPTLPWMVALLVAARRTVRARVMAAAGLTISAAVVAVWFRAHPFVPIQPSYLSNKPAYWVTLDGPAPTWMPSQAWVLVGLGSLLAAGCLTLVLLTSGVGGVRERRRRVDHDAGQRDRRVARAICLGFLGGGTALVVGLNAVRGFPTLDRYFLPLAPFLLAAVLALPVAGDRLRRVAAGALTLTAVAWAAWGVLASDAAATNDALRWSVGRELADQGWSPSTIDAGYEWWGAHQDVPTSAGPTRPGATFWTALFPGSPLCVQVSYAGAEGTGDQLVSRSAQTLSGAEIVVLARTADPLCATPVSPASP